MGLLGRRVIVGPISWDFFVHIQHPIHSNTLPNCGRCCLVCKGDGTLEQDLLTCLIAVVYSLLLIFFFATFEYHVVKSRRSDRRHHS